MILVLTDEEAKHLRFVLGADLEIVSNAISTDGVTEWERDKALSEMLLIKLNGGING